MEYNDVLLPEYAESIRSRKSLWGGRSRRASIASVFAKLKPGAVQLPQFTRTEMEKLEIERQRCANLVASEMLSEQRRWNAETHEAQEYQARSKLRELSYQRKGMKNRHRYTRWYEKERRQLEKLIHKKREQLQTLETRLRDIDEDYKIYCLDGAAPEFNQLAAPPPSYAEYLALSRTATATPAPTEAIPPIPAIPAALQALGGTGYTSFAPAPPPVPVTVTGTPSIRSVTPSLAHVGPPLIRQSGLPLDELPLDKQTRAALAQFAFASSVVNQGFRPASAPPASIVQSGFANLSIGQQTQPATAAQITTTIQAPQPVSGTSALKSILVQPAVLQPTIVTAPEQPQAQSAEMQTTVS